MSAKPVTLLLVDDDDVEAEMVSRSLTKARIANNLVRAKDGLEALEILRGETGGVLTRPLLVLLDLNMPRMNGLEFLQTVRADEELKNLIVFVLTTSNDEKDRAAAYDSNVSGYILKENAGADFVELVNMLEMFWNLVEFPDGEKPIGNA